MLKDKKLLVAYSVVVSFFGVGRRHSIPQNQNQSSKFPRVISRDSDWFMALFAPRVIGKINYFGIFFERHLKTALNESILKYRDKFQGTSYASFTWYYPRLLRTRFRVDSNLS